MNLLNELSQLVTKNKIEIWVQKSSFEELERWETKKLKNQMIDWIKKYANIDTNSYTIQPKDDETVETLLNKIKERANKSEQIKKIHSPKNRYPAPFENLNDSKKLRIRGDVDAFEKHIFNNRDYFVTLDLKDFIKNNRREEFEKKFGTKIRLLNQDFINELKKEIGE